MDYQYLIENKKMFLNLLNSILTPRIFFGLELLVNESQKTYKKCVEQNIKNCSQINIFRMYIDNIKKLNNVEIEKEYLKIKNSYLYSDLFDDIIKCAFKSIGLFLTYPNTTFLDNSKFQNIDYKNFIHKCYIECGEYFYNNPEILLKMNKKDKIYEIIEVCIENSIKLSLPLKEIMTKYIEKEFDIKNDDTSKLSKDYIETQITKLFNEKLEKEQFIDKIKTKNKDIEFLFDGGKKRKTLKNNSDSKNNSKDSDYKSKEKDSDNKSEEQNDNKSDDSDYKSDDSDNKTDDSDYKSEDEDVKEVNTDDDENFDREYHSELLDNSKLDEEEYKEKKNGFTWWK